uniref:preprotein-translocase subunit a n=1 Tax=Tenuicylindrus belgicus TaxID=1398096 RepID=UPI00223704EC|nr:preprotein-translocase subunit a [Tenuicylindrus belgicus]UYC31560.1 preprotein-translocase subunit a [Tenuicylindrus belgicus]
MLKNLFNKNSLANKYKNIINQINTLETNLKSLTDSELRYKTFELKQRYQVEQDLTNILPEAFAITREASVRTLGLRHFDVQLMGGLVLNEGRIAEMRTGEGKTLVATLPAYLNALTGEGVHIVTVNDYLARRDQTAMGQIYRFVGLNTGLIQTNMKTAERQANYNADITYVTNYELGFDYLRDNTAARRQEVVLRPLSYCIIDEIDSVLIDEARTPLILSSRRNASVDKFVIASEVVKYLNVNIDFKIDEKNKNIILTEQGIKQAELLLDVNDLYDEQNPWIPYILNALKALTLFFRNVHYIIQNQEIVIVDEFTGRIMPDRRWGDGLHQAIEAKEEMPIRRPTETMASITYQNFFLLYSKLAGMTGTAKTDEVEFEQIYNLSVDVIPTARPIQRKDLPDLVFKNQLAKWKAIAQECKQISETGQPILIGTTTIEKSEILAQLLKDYKLSYQLLNAKPENVKQESTIIAQAGKKSAITIATNMAGRGTDIILGGNLHVDLQKELYNILTFYRNQQLTTAQNENIFTKLYSSINYSQKFFSVLDLLSKTPAFEETSNSDLVRILLMSDQIWLPKTICECSLKYLLTQAVNSAKCSHKIQSEHVKRLGGLYIIGTERHESRRIDNQLRGRCGRQGDPGTSRFFLSLDDELLRLFGGPRLEQFMQNNLPDDTPLESNFLTKALDAAQRQVEERNYDNRRALFDYDDVLNSQRIVIFNDRRKILEANSLRKQIISFGEQIIVEIIDEIDDLKITELISLLEGLFATNLNLRGFIKNSKRISKRELKLYLFREFWLTYETKEASLQLMSIGAIREIERSLILFYNDVVWKEHLQKMAFLRESVMWRRYGQRNPLYEYKEEGYYLFLGLNEIIRHLVIFDLLHITQI